MNTAVDFRPYARVSVLSYEQQGKLAIRAGQGSFGFSAGLNGVPLLARELPLAMRHYPVVFVPDGPSIMPFAVLGLGDGINRFVDANGVWRGDAYVPAWIRRYPWISVRREDGGANVLGFDSDCSWLGQDGDVPLFAADGQPTPELQAAAGFCTEFDAEESVTREFCTALRDAGLLEEKNMRIEFPGAEPRTVDGFSVVREEALNALADQTVLDFHRKGYLALAHAHLLSLTNMARLLELANAQPN